jgi:hypothetical protein
MARQMIEINDDVLAIIEHEAEKKAFLASTNHNSTEEEYQDTVLALIRKVRDLETRMRAALSDLENPQDVGIADAIDFLRGGLTPLGADTRGR